MRLLYATVLGSAWLPSGSWAAAGFGAIAGYCIGAMMEPRLPKVRVSSRPEEWHASPSRRVGRKIWVHMQGIDPMNRYAFEPGLLGEHARWWLKTQMEHDRRDTWPWKAELPPPISTMVIEEDVEFEHEVAGWALTTYALWRCFR
jgi:hypothetical protein